MNAPRLVRWPAAALALLRIALATRFKLGGRYWRWRMETAFGRGRPGTGELIASTLGYGDWVARMRPHTKSPSRRLSFARTGAESRPGKSSSTSKPGRP